MWEERRKKDEGGSGSGFGRRMHHEARIRGHANRGRVAVRDSTEGAQPMRCPTTGTHGNLRQLRCLLAIPYDGRHVWGGVRQRRSTLKET